MAHHAPAGKPMSGPATTRYGGDRPKNGPELIGIVAVQGTVADSIIEGEPPFRVLLANTVDFANLLVDADAQVAGQFGDEKPTGVMIRRTPKKK